MNPFNDLAEIYDAMVDWNRRLSHEEPFYRQLFTRVSAKRVLDAACGVGHHAARFHAWGLDVEAADISPAMLARARARAGEPAGLKWVQRSYDRPAGTSVFDIAICVGNSLALADDEAAMDRAVAAMLTAVRPGGAVVVHVLNIWILADGPCLWQKCVRMKFAGQEVLVLKGIHRCGNRACVEVIVMDPAGKVLKNESPRLLGVEAGLLGEMARRHGAGGIEFFGGYKSQPYDRGSSEDIIMVARKAGG
ncbi:MAG: class I SAM-dependent methyltransferase [Tepidisphaeraceae bacterium]|jgi:SAM-dependent methyltransferase